MRIYKQAQASFTSKLNGDDFTRRKENTGSFGKIVAIQRVEYDNGVSTGKWADVEIGIHTYNLNLSKAEMAKDAINDLLETASEWQNDKGGAIVKDIG